ncbi:hypothetical protein YT1_4988 [Rhodococcus ruber]|nr:hypothetical protein YT1_4988 [Rhodococcus ruber]
MRLVWDLDACVAACRYRYGRYEGSARSPSPVLRDTRGCRVVGG